MEIDNRLKAFLDLIAWSEGTSTSPHTHNDGYDIIVGGADSPNTFNDYSTHPNILVTLRKSPLLQSTAAGRYQLLFRYFHPYCAQLGLKDFTPASQDAIVVQQIHERHALPMIEAGNIAGAIEACSNVWASLPAATGTGAYTGQSSHSVTSLVAQYNSFMEKK